MKQKEKNEKILTYSESIIFLATHEKKNMVLLEFDEGWFE